MNTLYNFIIYYFCLISKNIKIRAIITNSYFLKFIENVTMTLRTFIIINFLCLSKYFYGKNISMLIVKNKNYKQTPIILIIFIHIL